MPTNHLKYFICAETHYAVKAATEIVRWQ